MFPILINELSLCNETSELTFSDIIFPNQSFLRNFDDSRYVPTFSALKYCFHLVDYSSSLKAEAVSCSRVCLLYFTSLSFIMVLVLKLYESALSHLETNFRRDAQPIKWLAKYEPDARAVARILFFFIASRSHPRTLTRVDRSVSLTTEIRLVPRTEHRGQVVGTPALCSREPGFNLGSETGCPD
jgi:hypothetical protein